MLARERRIVAPDFRVSALGMIQEEEIVNGDHLRGFARRDQQRMGRMDDVGRSREPFDRRPFQPVPQVIQGRNRYATIDDGDAELGRDRRGRPVLPGAREHGHIIATMRGRVSPYELSDVLADARARAQSWTIVDEYPHVSAGMIASAVLYMVAG